MNKSELIEAAADRTQLSKSEVGDALDALTSTIVESVARGDKVAVTGFGTFERRDREQRKGRNPQTGKEMTIAAQKTPAFKAGKSFKEEVDR